MRKYEYIKRIPVHYQEQLGLQRLKISLNKCKNITEVRKVKLLLEYKTLEIFSNINDFNKEKAKNLLKATLLAYLIQNNQISTKNIERNVKEQELKKINKITIQEIIEKAIIEKEQEHKNKLKELEKSGIDTSKKQSSATVKQYKSILKYVNMFFKESFDVNDLNKDKAKAFREYLINFEKVNKNDEVSSIDNNTINLYIRQLKTIFKNYISEKDLNINNPFDNFKTLKIVKNKKMFTYDEIIQLKDLLDERYYHFLEVSLYSGMRYEEMITLKKKNIKEDCFVFHDAKANFKKVVPIHRTILSTIKKNIKDLGDDEYLFNDINRESMNKILKANFDKTLHKTRATFITYLNYFAQDFNWKDVQSLTHKLQGIDDKSYVVTRNIESLREIVNSIDFMNLKEIKIL